LTHGGNSGAALLRATRADGTSFVLKRITPGADWLARATHDDGRTARLHAAGAFKAMPSAIEHGVVAVERTDDAAWVAWRRGQGQWIRRRRPHGRATAQPCSTQWPSAFARAGAGRRPTQTGELMLCNFCGRHLDARAIPASR
jgi:hypothetical protein